MYKYIDRGLNRHTRTHKHINIQKKKFSNIYVLCVNSRIYIYCYLYVHVFLSLYMYACVYVCVCSCADLFIYTPAYICVYMFVCASVWWTRNELETLSHLCQQSRVLVPCLLFPPSCSLSLFVNLCHQTASIWILQLMTCRLQARI